MFPAVQPSQLCLLPCPPTSAPQKQYPAFSTQMEVTPYASKPLSFCQGSWGLAALDEVTMKESGAGMWRRARLSRSSFILFYSSFTCSSHFPSCLSLFILSSLPFFLFLCKPFSRSLSLSYRFLCSSSLRPSMCASVHLLKVLWQHHLLNINAPPKQQFSCKVCHKVW